MINMYHDPEVPAGYQDADLEMRDLREAANESYEQAFRGRCIDCHGRGGYQDYNNHGSRRSYQICSTCGGAGELF